MQALGLRVEDLGFRAEGLGYHIAHAAVCATGPVNAVRPKTAKVLEPDGVSWANNPSRKFSCSTPDQKDRK